MTYDDAMAKVERLANRLNVPQLCDTVTKLGAEMDKPDTTDDQRRGLVDVQGKVMSIIESRCPEADAAVLALFEEYDARGETPSRERYLDVLLTTARKATG